MDLEKTIQRLSPAQKKQLRGLVSGAKAAGIRLTRQNMIHLVEDVMDMFDDFSALTKEVSQ